MLRRFFIKQIAAGMSWLSVKKALFLNVAAKMTGNDAEDISVQRTVALNSVSTPQSRDTQPLKMTKTLMLSCLSEMIWLYKEDLKVIVSLVIDKQLLMKSVVAHLLKKIAVLTFDKTLGLKSIAGKLVSAAKKIRVQQTAGVVSANAVHAHLHRALRAVPEVDLTFGEGVLTGANTVEALSNDISLQRADAAEIKVLRTIRMESSVVIACPILLSANKTIMMECVADMRAEADTWKAPVQTGSDLYIRSVYDAQQSGDNLHIGKTVFTDPVQTGDSLHITSVYAAVQNGRNLLITSVESMKGGVDNG